MKVLITGGNTGIGLATAREFKAHGYEVIITYLEGKPIKDFECIKCDITKPKDIKKLSKYKVDVLVNNAGYLKHSKMKNLTVDDWRKTFEVNLFGMFNVIKNVKVKECIINIASIRGIEPAVHDMDYSASKAGVISLTKAMAKELAPVRVNSISPGITKTKMVKGYKKKSRKTKSQTLLKRMANPEEIAMAVRTVSELTYMTGQNVIVDGGYCVNT